MGYTSKFTGQEIDNLLTQVQEGGTGGGGVQLLEVRYNWDGSELTDEDKAVNAATYAKVATGEKCIIYNDGLGLRIYSVILGAPSAEAQGIFISFESELVYVYGWYKVAIIIAPDGSVVEKVPIGDKRLIFLEELITSYTTLETALIGIGLISTSWENAIIQATIKIDSTTFRLEGRLGYIEFSNGSIDMIVNQFDGTILEITARQQDDSVWVYILNNAEISLITSSSNRFIFNENLKKVTNINSARIKDADRSYVPINYKVIYNTTEVAGIELVIYRNGTFETWQINSDGTTLQIAS